ncbi:MAG: hypothetical protein PVI40_01080 [Chlamydiota bacterium]|jgi:hypothetical protein
MKSFAKLFLALTFLFVVAFSSIKLKKLATGGFKSTKLLHVKKVVPFPEDVNSHDLLKILNQPYRYLDRGTQFYVFESKDKKYVIKLLRSDRLTHTLLDRFFLTRKKRRKIEKYAEKTNSFINACKMANHSLPQETAVIYFHHHISSDLPTITLIDNVHLKRSINLNKYCFVVQKKVKLIKEALYNAQLNKDLVFGKKLVASFFDTVSSRIQKNIVNTDPNFLDNFGVLGETVVELDFGDFTLVPHLHENHKSYVSEIEKHAIRLKSWLIKYWPELVEHFDIQYHKNIAQ